MARTIIERTPSMWTLSGFSDEISPEFEEQCSVVSSLGMKFLEFRSAWDVNILDLDDAQLAKAKDILSAHGLGVSSIGSPIGKILIDENFDPHLERMRHAADVAHYFDAPYIRIFSFFMPAGSDPDSHREEVLRRMTELARVAEQTDVILLHENEKEIYGDIPRRCLDIVESVGSLNLKVAWMQPILSRWVFAPSPRVTPCCGHIWSEPGCAHRRPTGGNAWQAC